MILQGVIANLTCILKDIETCIGILVQAKVFNGSLFNRVVADRDLVWMDVLHKQRELQGIYDNIRWVIYEKYGSKKKLVQL